MVLKDGSKFFLEENEAEIVKQAIKNGSHYLEVGDNLISSNDFSRIVGSENYEEAERRRHGEWKCEFCGRWHPRGEECGCQGGKF